MAANPGLLAEVQALVDCLIDARIIVVVQPPPDNGCPDCFTTIPDDRPWPPGLLNNQFLPKLLTGDFQLDGVTVESVDDICELLGLDGTTTTEFEEFLNEIIPGAANKNTIEDVIACLLASGDLIIG